MELLVANGMIFVYRHLKNEQLRPFEAQLRRERKSNGRAIVTTW
jgi:hypothetical protein